MPVYVMCPACKNRGSLPDTFKGGRVRCPSCGSLNQFASSGALVASAPPSSQSVPAARPQAQPQRPPQPAPRPQPQQQGAPAFMDDFEEPVAPPQQVLARAGGGQGVRKSPGMRGGPDDKPKSNLPLLLGVGGGLALVLAVVMVVVVQSNKSNDSAIPSAPEGVVASGDSDYQAVADNSTTPRMPPGMQGPGRMQFQGPSPGFVPFGNAPPIPANEVVTRVKDSTVYIKLMGEKSGGTGSGFVIKVDGSTVLVATNRHVITPHSSDGEEIGEDESDDPAKVEADKKAAGKFKLTVVFRSGEGQGREQELPAKVLAADSNGAHDTTRDLAVLKVEGVKNPPQPLGFNRAEPQLSMNLRIFGFPFGRSLNMGISRGNPEVTVNKASVSSVRHNDLGQTAAIQVDGSVQPGNSGGPVVDDNGQLVGVTVAKLSMADGIGIIIPSAHLDELLAGRLGRINLQVVSSKDGKYEFDAESELADPLSLLREADLRIAPLTGEPPKPSPDPKTGIPLLPNTTPAVFKLDQQAKTAKVRLTVPLAAGIKKVLVQFTFTAGDGRKFVSMPMTFTLPEKTGRLLAIGESDSIVRDLIFGAWKKLGPLIDPDKDCKLTKSQKTVKIEVPGKLHTLSPQLIDKKKGVLNAPMTLATVEGDFLMHVHVGGVQAPGTTPLSSPKTKRQLPYAFQSAGIVLWEDADNFIRLERATQVERGSATNSNKLLVEVYKGGKLIGEPFYLDVPADELSLMMMRYKGQIRCLFSMDGKKWAALQTIAETYPGKIKVGLAAVNLSKNALTAEFEQFILLDENEKNKLDEEIQKLQ